MHFWNLPVPERNPNCRWYFKRPPDVSLARPWQNYSLLHLCCVLHWVIFKLSSQVCRADHIENGFQTTILLPPTNGELEDWVSGMFHLLHVHGRGVQWDLAVSVPWLTEIHKPLLYSLSLSPRFPAVYSFSMILKANRGLRGHPEELACLPLWNGREGPGNQDGIFLLVKVEKLPRDLELNQ